MINCMIAGVGGQGTVLASKLIAAAAINSGFDVRTTETIGMAQRGGCVVSHIRIGSNNIHSPLIPQKNAHIIIAFEPAEAVRLLPYLSDNGLLIVCDNAIKPFTNPLSGDIYNASVMTDYLKTHVTRLVTVSGERLLTRCGNVKTLNVALLGIAAQSGVFPFGAEEFNTVIKEMLPKHFWEINLASFEIGRRMYDESCPI